jgi:hypothetical protein
VAGFALVVVFLFVEVDFLLVVVVFFFVVVVFLLTVVLVCLARELVAFCGMTAENDKRHMRSKTIRFIVKSVN